MALCGENTLDISRLSREVSADRLPADGLVVRRATVAGRDDDGTAQDFPGLFKQINQSRIDVDLSAPAMAGKLLFREVGRKRVVLWLHEARIDQPH